ncbi:NosD domain-containing protein, partial [Candidatus Margulisiibacteriota bacterium]
DTSSYNKIGSGSAEGRNVISGNNTSGIYIYDSSISNEVYGNYLGLSASGTQELENTYGIYVKESDYNKIGNGTAGGRNVISGNSSYGLYLFTVNSTEVLGNYIGTGISGGVAFNNANGIQLQQDSYYNVIGDGTEGGRNIISGNTTYGMNLAAAYYTQILGNYIGPMVSGETAFSDQNTGIFMENTSNYNQIGDGTEGGRNVISGHTDYGIRITGCFSNEVQGNYIGLTASGEAALSNTDDNVQVINGSMYNLIGGDVAGEGNVISASTSDYGVMISNSTYNMVVGNYIGTDKNGTADLGNASYGVYLYGAAKYNLIGSTESGGGNVISGNNSHGVYITGSGTNSNEVIGNYIGTDKDGNDASIGNSFHGVFIDTDAAYIQIGPDNIIAHNGISSSYDGVRVDGTCSYVLITQNTMEANYNKGIYLEAGANNDIPAPVITNAVYIAGDDQTTVTGTAISDATVEIFLTDDSSDTAGEGKVYLATVTAEGTSWIATLEGAVVSLGEEITTTASSFESPGYTSEFSENGTVEVLSVTVDAPDGGESWGRGTTNDITWTTNLAADTIKIYLSIDNGVSWSTLATNETDDGSYSWFVRENTTTDALVSIEAIKGSDIATDESDAVFAITSATNLYVDANIGDNDAYNGLSSSISGSTGPWKNISYASTQAASGATINVAAGTYNAATGESFTLTIPAGVHLLSTSTGLATIDAENTADDVVTLGTGATIEGFTVNIDNTDDYYCVYAGQDTDIKNNVITGVARGVYSQDTGVKVLDNTIECSADAAYGVYFAAASDNGTIDGNVITLTGDGNNVGVFLYNGADGCTVSGNTVEANYFGIYIRDENDDFTITENVIRGEGRSSSRGITSLNGSDVLSGTVSSNEVDGYEMGIYANIDPADTWDISHNTIVNFTQYGIYGGNQNATYNIKNNIVTGTSSLGSYVDGSYGIYFTGTTATRNISYNDVWNIETSYTNCSAGTGAISRYPRFVTPESDDLRIYDDSPCAGTGDGGANMGKYAPIGSDSDITTEGWVNAASGNDSTGDGTSSTPWKTLAYALKKTEYTLIASAGAYDAANGEDFPVTLAQSQYLKSLTTLATIDAAGAASHVVVLGPTTTLEGMSVKTTNTLDSFWGVYAYNYADIRSNAITAAERAVYVNGTSVEVISNTVDCSGINSYGIYVYSSTGAGNYSTDFCSIEGNVIYALGSGSRGIYLHSEADGATIRNNTIEAVDAGVMLYDDNDDYLVSGNIVRGTGAGSSRGLSIGTSTYDTYSGDVLSNEVDGFETGIYTNIDPAHSCNYFNNTVVNSTFRSDI